MHNFGGYRLRTRYIPINNPIKIDMADIRPGIPPPLESEHEDLARRGTPKSPKLVPFSSLVTVIRPKTIFQYYVCPKPATSTTLFITFNPHNKTT